MSLIKYDKYKIKNLAMVGGFFSMRRIFGEIDDNLKNYIANVINMKLSKNITDELQKYYLTIYIYPEEQDIIINIYLHKYGSQSYNYTDNLLHENDGLLSAKYNNNYFYLEMIKKHPSVKNIKLGYVFIFLALNIMSYFSMYDFNTYPLHLTPVSRVYDPKLENSANIDKEKLFAYYENIGFVKKSNNQNMTSTYKKTNDILTAILKQ
jgi:hypothetical protein